ncbi:uncharacterized protein LTR77_000364 [Saxophila tyrrhenica]|uniref:Uncharacterized protein n=1 Tax=Saxophila tyrrhenica TaxID=1690608 RepID=A0AAV9PQY6_9PEZI|nr:hypothetical protein LTR77_000364 [Saxophila tyrrhenica]
MQPHQRPPAQLVPPPAPAPAPQPAKDLSKYSGLAWHAINTKYSDSRGSKEYEKAIHAIEDVCEYVEAIREAAMQSGAAFKIKQSALETLRKIGKSICLSVDVTGSEVRKWFQSERFLDEAMLEVLKIMTVDEVLAVAHHTDEKGQFFDKLEAL